MDLGTLDNVTEAVFMASKDAKDDRRYLLQVPGRDYLETLTRFPSNDIKRTSEHYIDDPEGRWFAFYNVDCFDPPFAIIRARSFETAYEIFCDEFERWLAVDATAAVDYPEDDRNYNGNGTHIDTDNVHGHELFLVSVSMVGAE
jgi:hypothetical protein